MATKRKKGALATAGKKVKQAARKVVETADEYVVDPVGRALGLKKKKAGGRKPAARTKAAKRPAKATAAKRGARKK